MNKLSILATTTFVVLAAIVTTIAPVNIPIAYSQETCKEIEENYEENYEEEFDKTKCKAYEGELGLIESSATNICAENKGEDFKCNKVWKEDTGSNINKDTRESCEFFDELKCKQVK